MISVTTAPLAVTEQVLAWAASAAPLESLAPSERARALASAQVLDLGPGRTLFPRDLSGEELWYLQEGELALRYGAGRLESLKARSPQASRPFNPLPADCVGVTAISTTRLVRIDLASLKRAAQTPTTAAASASAAAAATQAPAMSMPVVHDLSEDRDWMSTLLESELFHRLPLGVLHHIFSRLEAVPFRKGEAVVRQDEPGDFYYIVREGRCEVRRQAPHGPAVVLGEFEMGDRFGEEALVGDCERSASVIMLTDGVLMRLRKSDFRELIQNPLLRPVTRLEAEELVKRGAVWVDVRFPEDQAAGQFPGSLSIPVRLLRTRVAKLQEGLTYITYCDTGSRAAIAAFLLAERGFEAYYLAEPCLPRPAGRAAPGPSPAERERRAEHTAEALAALTPRQTATPLDRQLAGVLEALEQARPLREAVRTAQQQLQGAGAPHPKLGAAAESMRQLERALDAALSAVHQALEGKPSGG